MGGSADNHQICDFKQNTELEGKARISNSQEDQSKESGRNKKMVWVSLSCGYNLTTWEAGCVRP